MIIGNRTQSPIMLHIAEKRVFVPAMGFVTLDDTKDNLDSLEELKTTAMFKRLLDGNYLTLSKITAASSPVEIKTPTPPAELTQEPAHPRVKRGKAQKTKETMKV